MSWMQLSEREYHIQRIIYGRTVLEIDGLFYEVGFPSREHRYLAERIYRNILNNNESVFSELMNEEDCIALLKKKGLWNNEKDNQLKDIEKEIENGKVGLYQNWNNSTARHSIRSVLNALRHKQAELYLVKTSLNQYTLEHQASVFKTRMLVGASVYLPGGAPYWPQPALQWEKEDVLLDRIMDELLKERLTELQFRELARTEPWNSYWVGRKSSSSLFGVASVDMTEEQLNLVRYSSFYDSVRDSSDRPSEDVIEDDDMLDGWVILQKRLNDKNHLQKRGDEKISDRVRNSDEIYVMAGSQEDANLINDLNDDYGKMIKSRRAKELKGQEDMSEMQFSDMRQRFDMEMNQLETKKMRGEL